MPKKASSEREHLQVESLQPIIAELERAVVWAYGLTGDRDKGLPKVTVVIQTQGKKASCRGWFKTKAWSTKEGDPIHELTVCAERLYDDPIEVIQTVIHETAHLWNKDVLPEGEKDCSDSGRHNKKFREAAETFGLEVETSKTGGHNVTSLSDDLRRQIEEDLQPDLAVFRLFRELVPPKESKATKKKVIPWICECPITAQIASGVTFDATCEICHEAFVEKEKS